MSPNTRITLQIIQVHLRAAIRDFLLSLVKENWIDEVRDEPGLTEFVFFDQWGAFGSLRIYEIQAGKTVFAIYPPVEAPEPETIALLISGGISLNLEDKPSIEIVFRGIAESRERDADLRKMENLFKYLLNLANAHYPGITRKEWDAAMGYLVQCNQQVLLRRQEKHSKIIGQIVWDLKMQGLWNPVGQEAGLNPQKLSTYNEESTALTAGPAGTEETPENLKSKRGPKSGSPEEKRAVVDEWLRVQNNETQTAFCLRKHISKSTLRNWLNRV